MIEVRNWEKHQHRDFAKQKSQKWLRLDATLFDDEKVAALDAWHFRAYIRMLTLAARTGNKIPSSPNYLRAQFGTRWRNVCTTLEQLSLINVTELVTETPAKPAPVARPPRGESALEERQEIHELRDRSPKEEPQDGEERTGNVVKLPSRTTAEFNGKKPSTQSMLESIRRASGDQ